MALILSIDTSTTVCSVALHENGKLLALQENHSDYSHSEHLAPMIEQINKQMKVKPSDYGAIAVSKGPGSYTGLRIGVSAAKGLCYAVNKPLLSISTLHIMCEEFVPIIDSNTLLCPMIDARRMEVYTMVMDSVGEIVEDISAKIVDNSSFQGYLENSKVLFFGDGASKCQSVITSGQAIFVQNAYPSAKHMGRIADKLYQEEKFENVAYFEPFYLKDFVTIKPKKNLLA